VVEAEHNQGIEEPEGRGGDHTHIDRRNIGQMPMAYRVGFPNGVMRSLKRSFIFDLLSTTRDWASLK